MRKYFRILVGVPASGKSYWLDKYGYSSSFSHDIHSTDNIVMELAGPDVSYDEAWVANIKQAERIFWDRIDQSIANRREIIIDRTNITRKTRARFFTLLEKKEARDYYHVSAEIFGTQLPVSEWYSRLGSRPGKTIPPHVLKSMVENYEVPSYDEGYDSIVEWNNI